MKTTTNYPRGTKFSGFAVDLMLPNLQNKEVNNLGKTIT